MFVPFFPENIFLKTQIQCKTPEREKKITIGQISLCLNHEKNHNTSFT